MRKIENIIQLRQEYARLDALKTEQEVLLKRDLDELVESLKPVNLLKNLATDLFDRRNDKSLWKGGLNLGLHLLANKLLSQGGIMKTILTFVGQNVASNLIVSNSGGIINKLKGMFNFGKKKEMETEDEINENDLRNSPNTSHRYN